MLLSGLPFAIAVPARRDRCSSVRREPKESNSDRTILRFERRSSASPVGDAERLASPTLFAISPEIERANKGVARIAAGRAAIYKAAMRKLLVNVYFAALVAPLLSACQTTSGPVEEPIVHLSDLRVKDVQLFEQRYALVLRVENPNPQELPVSGLSYRVLLNKVELGRGASRQSITIPPYGESVIEVDLVSNTVSLVQRVRDITAGAINGVKVSITGNMNLTNRQSPLPFSFQGDFGGSQS